MEEFLEITVDPIHEGKRLDLFLASQLLEESRSRIQGLIKEGLVTSEGKKRRSSEKVTSGEIITIQKVPKPTLAQAFPEEIPLSVLFEDEDLIVINKPAGMVVHVAPDHLSGTLVNALLYRWNHENLAHGSAPYRPGIVHRLDKETSGCIIVAKNDQTHASLSSAFAARKIKKTYLAIVLGKPRQRIGTISLPIGRHPIQRLKMTIRHPPAGRDAITDYELLAFTEKYSLLACSPHTGRMHQIRVHLQHLGHPIAGDPLYGKRDSWNRHLLHAWKIEFIHPRTGMAVLHEAPPPKEFDFIPLKK